MAGWIQARMGPADRMVTKRQLIHETNGKTYLMPTLIMIDQPAKHPLLQLELPFPYSIISQISMLDVPQFTGVSNYVYNLNINSPMLPEPLISGPPVDSVPSPLAETHRAVPTTES